MIKNFEKFNEEYRYFKFDMSKDNIKDKNEPFFVETKYDYKRKKEIFGKTDFSKYDSGYAVEIDEHVIDEFINKGHNISRKLNRVLNEIKHHVTAYTEFLKCGIEAYCEIEKPDNFLTYEDLDDYDIKKLMQFGFGVHIHNHKCEIWWEWKNKE